MDLATTKVTKYTVERFNWESLRRTRVIWILWKAEKCLRLVRALTVETRERWLAKNFYLNMEYAQAQHRGTLRQAARSQTELPAWQRLQKTLDTTLENEDASAPVLHL